MVCTNCGKRGARASKGQWTRQDDEALLTAGWFLYQRGCALPYSGVALCPNCRKLPTSKDAFGVERSTSELERLASVRE